MTERLLAGLVVLKLWKTGMSAKNPRNNTNTMYIYVAEKDPANESNYRANFRHDNDIIILSNKINRY